jgi:hypothetical protein
VVKPTQPFLTLKQKKDEDVAMVDGETRRSPQGHLVVPNHAATDAVTGYDELKKGVNHLFALVARPAARSPATSCSAATRTTNWPGSSGQCRMAKWLPQQRCWRARRDQPAPLDGQSNPNKGSTPPPENLTALRRRT